MRKEESNISSTGSTAIKYQSNGKKPRGRPRRSDGSM